MCISIYVSNATRRLIASNTESIIPPSLAGPFLAQIVQSSLTSARHPSKQIAMLALKIITRSLEITTLYDKLPSRPTEMTPGYILWRTYYPGVFSSLFSLCASKGNKTANSVKTAAVILLIKITTVVTQDLVHQRLLSSLAISVAETASVKFLRSIQSSISAARPLSGGSRFSTPTSFIRNYNQSLDSNRQRGA